MQPFRGQFPTQPNREFFGANRVTVTTKQGIPSRAHVPGCPVVLPSGISEPPGNLDSASAGVTRLLAKFALRHYGIRQAASKCRGRFHRLAQRKHDVGLV
jgi:hypothetical protein